MQGIFEVVSGSVKGWKIELPSTIILGGGGGGALYETLLGKARKMA